MWLGDEFEEANLEIATQGWRSPDASAPATEAAPVLELSDAELSQLAEDEGWDLAEVEAIRSLLGRPTETMAPTADAETASASGGPDEPDEPKGPGGMGAGGADAQPPEPAEGHAEDPPEDPTDGSAELPRELRTEQVARPQPMPRPMQVASPLPAMGDPQWLKGRRGPAADAYRRLRRLFPG
jgi:hypothetical protein